MENNNIELNNIDNNKGSKSEFTLKILLSFLALLFLALIISSFIIKNDSEKFDIYMNKISQVEVKSRGNKYNNSEERLNYILTQLIEVEPQEQSGREVKKALEEYKRGFEQLKLLISTGAYNYNDAYVQKQILSLMKSVQSTIYEGIDKYKLNNKFYSIEQFFLVPGTI